MLTTKPKQLRSTSMVESGLRDMHKLIISFVNVHFKKLAPKTIEYQNYKNFDINSFLHELDQELTKVHIYRNSNDKYDVHSCL